MRNKKIIFAVLILVIIAAIFYYKSRHAEPNGEITEEIKPFMGNIQNTISTTGIVLPKNRLEIKPPVNGRIEEILIKEGDKVNVGQTLAWMSSTERAALLDAAHGQGEDSTNYWKQVYKPIALIAPIDGEVIVATVQPGQTVTTGDAVIVLSDRLIVRAQADETDIGKIKLGQSAWITLDAYPDTKIKATVDHIYYESKTVNNVTIYEVDLLPENVPEFFRSGMNASIDFIVESKDNALLLPEEALSKEKDKAYVLVKSLQNGEPTKQPVELGISDGKNIEIVSGIGPDDTVILKTKKYALPKSNTGTNPFFPARPRR